MQYTPKYREVTDFSDVGVKIENEIKHYTKSGYKYKPPFTYFDSETSREITLIYKNI